jgi:hypothetical protein
MRNVVRELLREEIPSSRVRRSSLRYLIIWSWFDSMDQVRKFDGVLNEKDGDVVANHVYGC